MDQRKKDLIPCPGCGGSGQTSFFGGESRFMLTWEDCPDCSGTGILLQENDSEQPQKLQERNEKIAMTPAINAAKKAKIAYTIHQYAHDPAAASYGKEAAEKLGLDEARVFKTLVVELDSGSLAVGIIPVAAMLSMKLMAKAAGVKKAAMADKGAVERTTGYVLGGVSPLGQKKRLATFIDASAAAHPTIYVSAGRRGLDIELKPADLASLTGARFVPLSEEK